MKNHAKTLLGFAAGFICAGIVAFFLLSPPVAQGYDPCFKSDLKWAGEGRYVGGYNLPVMLYSVPSCITAKGYRASVAGIENGKIRVIYDK